MGMPADRAAVRRGPIANNATGVSKPVVKAASAASIAFTQTTDHTWKAGDIIIICVTGGDFHIRFGTGAQTATTSDGFLTAGVHDLEMPPHCDSFAVIGKGGATITPCAWKSDG